MQVKRMIADKSTSAWRPKAALNLNRMWLQGGALDENIAKLFASKFIARHDIKAIQRANGEYNPVNSKITKTDLLDHLSGRHTYGHYLLSPEGECKVLVFDIDLVGSNRVPTGLVPTTMDDMGKFDNFVPMNCREVWRDRSRKVERAFLKVQLRSVANQLTRLITDVLEIPAAVAYTGAKGLHVYGFTGRMPARDVRYAGEIVIAEHGKLEPDLGNHSFKFKKEYDEWGNQSCATSAWQEPKEPEGSDFFS
jgi:hypothetical protein